MTEGVNLDTENYGWRWLANLGQDLKGGYRGLRRSPLFALVVVAVLALGIGATAALFAVVDNALLRPLAGPDADRMVWLSEYGPTHEEAGGSPQRFLDWQKARSFTSMCALYSDSAILAGDGRPVRLRLLHTLGDPSQTFGLKLLRGRPFTAAENKGAGEPVALITSDVWHKNFSSDLNVFNRAIRLGPASYRIVGILDSDAVRGAEYPEGIDVWTPATGDVAHAPREAGFLAQVGRLNEGVTLEQARAELSVIGGQLAKAYPATDKGRSTSLIPLQEYESKEARKPLLTLLTAVGAVLLIACVNIAGLLVARGLSRQREAAIRVSVGAGFIRLARLFFAESLILAALGCTAGLCAAYVFIGILKVALPAGIPHLSAISLDWRVAACAVVVAALSALLFGAIPAWQFASMGQSAALKSGGRGATSSGQGRLRASLVVIEVALSLVLLVTATLLTNSFFQLRNQTSGFNASNAYSFGVPFGWDSDPALLNSFASGALTRLTTSPGIMAAGVVDRLPLHGGSQSGPMLVKGMDLSGAMIDKQVSFRTASAGYFAAAGVPVVAGSLYRDRVAGKGEQEALITDRLAALLFPGGNAVGQLVARAPRGQDVSQAPRWFRVVGVVGSVRINPTDAAPEAGVYLPWGATYWPDMNFVVRSTRGLAEFTRLVRDHVQPLTNAQLVEKIGTLEESTAETRTAERTRAVMLTAFAAAALALSAIGLFGTLSHEVARRTQDYGVRLALGAEPMGIAWSAVRSALLLAGGGVVAGIAASVWTSQFLEGQLFGVEPSDARAYTTSAGVLLLTAVLAAIIPAARAARIDPIQALRHE